MDERIYAPIIIPTLNRYDHFKRCIESLKKNELAKYTDIFISLDYPPSEKYVDGYKLIREYLENGIEGFATCNIFYQEENLGAYENIEFLRAQIEGKYDRYIFTEDDNEFAPAFLEYIDKGLELFADNKSISLISGYTPYDYKPETERSIWYDQSFAAWGYGTWIDKENEIHKYINRNSFDTIIRDKKTCQFLYKKYPNRYWQLVEALTLDPANSSNCFVKKNGDLFPMDYLNEIVMAICGLFAIRPSFSLVRNMGVNDGSGMHCNGVNYDYSSQPIDVRESFEFEGTESVCDYVPPQPEYDHRCKRARVIRWVYIHWGNKLAQKVLNADYLFSNTVIGKHVHK